MSLTITAGEVQTLAGQIGDLMTAVQYKLANLAADEQLAEDILGDLAALGVPYAGAVQAVIPLLGWAITHNQSAKPGALSHVASGRKGSDPWEDGA